MDSNDCELNVASDHVDGEELALNSKDALLASRDRERRQKVVSWAYLARVTEPRSCYREQIDAANNKHNDLGRVIARFIGIANEAGGYSDKHLHYVDQETENEEDMKAFAHIGQLTIIITFVIL